MRIISETFVGHAVITRKFSTAQCRMVTRFDNGILRVEMKLEIFNKCATNTICDKGTKQIYKISKCS